MKLSLLFDLANVAVLPFWALLLLAPRREFTRRIFDSNLPFAAFALLYAYGFTQSLDPESLESLANPTLAGLARVFGTEPVVFTGWMHFLTLDLWAGRWIWEQSLTRNYPFRHSVALTLFAGPLGVLSHTVTGWICDALRAKTAQE